MAKPKKTGRKPSVKVDDMSAKENPKGGAFNAFLKISDIKGESQMKSKGLKSGLKLNTAVKIE